MNRTLWAAALALVQQGCATTYYLGQAFRGQMAIQNRAKPLTVVLSDERTSPDVKALLERVAEIKAYGESEGGLKPTKNYEHYVDLKRPAVVWSVSACEKLKFSPKEWGFPVVGSFTYLGWFSEDDARKHARDLETEGWDVDVRPVTAYSTLGYFRDPIVSTMLGRGPAALGYLANVILHESVHATVYVNNQSSFNESLASFVADRLAPVYLRTRAPDRLSPYEESEKQQVKAVALLRGAYQELEGVYSNSNLNNDQKLARKAAVFAKLKADLSSKRDFNNASIVGFKTYDTGEEHFRAAFARCGQDMKRFVDAAGHLKEADFGEAQATDLAGPLSKLCAAAP